MATEHPPFTPDHLFRRAFEHGALGMALVGLDGNWQRVNRSLCELLGYSQRELLQTSFVQLTPPDDLTAARIPSQQLIAGEIEYWSGEQRIRHRSGQLKWVLLNASLVRDNYDQPHCFFAQFQDLTPQREAQKLEERLFQLPVALHFVAGFDGYFKKLSPSWAEVLGHSIEYLLSVPYLDLVHPDDRPTTVSEVQRVTDCTNTFLFENRYRHADGSYRSLLWTSITAPEEGLVYGVALDYTARKEAELKLAESLQNLRRVLSELHASQEQIEKLRQGLVTVCAWTKRIQHDGRWMGVDEFLANYLHLSVTHGISEEAMQSAIASLDVPKAAGEKP